MPSEASHDLSFFSPPFSWTLPPDYSLKDLGGHEENLLGGGGGGLSFFVGAGFVCGGGGWVFVPFLPFRGGVHARLLAFFLLRSTLL